MKILLILVVEYIGLDRALVMISENFTFLMLFKFGIQPNLHGTLEEA